MSDYEEISFKFIDERKDTIDETAATVSFWASLYMNISRVLLMSVDYKGLDYILLYALVCTFLKHSNILQTVSLRILSYIRHAS